MASPCLGGPFSTPPIKAVKAGCSDDLLLLLLEVDIPNPQISFYFMFLAERDPCCPYRIVLV